MPDLIFQLQHEYLDNKQNQFQQGRKIVLFFMILWCSVLHRHWVHMTT